MKQILLIAFLFATSLSLSAQIEKGTFMGEGGINLTGIGNYYYKPLSGGFGISFGTQDNIGKDYGSGKDQFYSGSRGFEFSLSPRLGYSILRNFLLGVDLNLYRYYFGHSPYKEDDKGHEKLNGYGFFARKYFGARKFTPFIEAEFGFLTLTYFEHSSSPGGGIYSYNENNDFSYYGGALGYSFAVNPKFKINLLAKLRHTKESKAISPDYKTLNFDSAMVLSFSYFLNRKTKLALK
jgi:hypothetical protein